MPKVTFTTFPLICVSIKGEARASSGRFPQIPDDGDLVSEFNRFLLDEKIEPIIPGGHSGGGSFLGFFTAKDAAKIEAWLVQKKVQRIKCSL
jgi:hypothetical protein